MVSAVQRIVVLAAALTPLAGAVQMAAPADSLHRRQSFKPGEIPVNVKSCSEIGPGVVSCRAASALREELCMGPGWTCCEREWACPPNSFCLINGHCCPNGYDPQTCAEMHNVVLPPDYGKTPPSEPDAGPTSSAVDYKPAPPAETSVAPTATGIDTAEPTDTTEPNDAAEPSESFDVDPPSASFTPPVEAGASSLRDIGVVGVLAGFAALAL